VWERERTRWFIRWEAPEVEGVEEEQNHLPVSTHMATDSGLEIWQYRQWYSGREGLDSIEDREEEDVVEEVEEASSESDSSPSASLPFASLKLTFRSGFGSGIGSAVWTGCETGCETGGGTGGGMGGVEEKECGVDKSNGGDGIGNDGVGNDGVGNDNDKP